MLPVEVLTAYRYLMVGNVVPSGRQWDNACLTSINTSKIQSPASREALEVLETSNNMCIRVCCLDNIKGKKKGELTLTRKGIKDKVPW